MRVRGLVASIAVLIGVALAPAAASAASSTLKAGTTLTQGQQLVSPDGQYALTMQPDGELVESITQGSTGGPGRVVWATPTTGDNGAYAVMQTNGNLVVYDASGSPVWSSNSKTTGCGELAVRNDGNLVVYDANSTPVWSAGTEQSGLSNGDVLEPGWGRYSPNENTWLVMQGDGNLVLYDKAAPLWNSETSGHPGAWAVLQTDGNFVIYGPNGEGALWNSQTSGHAGDIAWVQSDGNFVVYAGSTPLWQAGTGGAATATSVAPAAPAPGGCPAPPALSPAPVQTAPVSTPLPTPAPSPRALAVKLTISWTWNRAVTRVRKVKVGTFPGSTQLTVRCAGRGCPRRRTVRAKGIRKLRRVLHSLQGRRYRAGDRVLITLAAPGYQSERAQIRIRWGRSPQIKLLS